MATSKGIMAAKRAEIEKRPELVLQLLKSGPQTSTTVMRFLGLIPTTSNKAAREALRMLAQHGLAVEIHLGDGRWWTVPGSVAEAELIARRENSAERRAKRDRKAEMQRRERAKAQKERIRLKKMALQEEAEREEAAWHYPVKRVVSDWKTTIPPLAVRSVFELGGML